MAQHALVACVAIDALCALLAQPHTLRPSQQLSARTLVDLHNLGDVHALHGACARTALRLWALLDGALPVCTLLSVVDSSRALTSL